MGVIGVSSSAFIGQDTITSVKFGSTCTYVGKDAFNKCISLSKINDNNVIEEIYDGAFANTKLSSVNFNKLKSIIGSIGTSGAFANCSYLTNVNIPNCTEIGQSAFTHCEKLTNIDLKNCKKIESEAFSYCKSLEEVTINTESGANDVLAIGDYAFLDCTNLKRITLLPYSYFGGIGNYAFFNCINLSVVYIKTPSVQQETVPVIPLGSDVFYCYTDKEVSEKSIINNLKIYLSQNIFENYYTDPNWSVYKDYMIKLPDDNQIFYNTSNNIIIDIDGDSDYFDSDYYNQYGITSHKYDNNTGSILFENNVTALNKKIFKNNKEITSIYLPCNCSEVGELEFEGCTSLDSFNPYPLDVLKTIGNCAFKDCTSLKSFTIPESIESLGEGIFAGCSNIEKFEGKFTSYGGNAIVYNNTLISVAPKYNNKTDESYYKISDISSNINRLGNYCFSGCKELRRVDMSYSTYIGDFAFEGCDNLREVHFYGGYPSGTIEFGENAFGIFKKDENGYYVVDENKIDFKIFIPESSFSSCLDEENISTNSWIKVYKNYIYPEPSNKQIVYYTDKSQEDNKNYHLIELHNDEIKINSFGDNIDIKSISKIIIGEEVSIINSNVFKSCENLEYIYLPNSLDTIGTSTFQECKNLNYISIPNNIEVIGQHCFGKSGIKEFNINYGSKLRKISKSAFINCSNLTTVDLSKLQTLTLIDNRTFYFCENLTNVVLPNTITSIEDYAFAGCEKIISITLPEGLKRLGEYCLATGSPKTKIYIPKSLSTPPVFTISGKETEESYPFDSTTKNIPNIYVPSDLYDIYINNKYWCKYKDKIIKQ